MDYDYETIDERFTKAELCEMQDSQEFTTLVGHLHAKDLDITYAPDLARVLAHEGFYKPAVALFEGALRSSDSHISDSTDYHEKLHALYGFTLRHLAQDFSLRAADIGVPVNQFSYDTTSNGSMFIKDFSYSQPAQYPQSIPEHKKHEDTLARAHLIIAQHPHEVTHCPL